MNLIEFIYYENACHPNFNPVPAKKLIPEWYKKLDKYIGDKSQRLTASSLLNNKSAPLSIKACIPVQDYMCNGYIIKATADLLFTQGDLVNNETSWCWYSAQEKLMNCGAHEFKQLPVELNKEKHTYIKIIHNIGIRTPKDYSCLFYQPEFFFENKFKLFPGVVDTDSYHNPINFPGIITSKDTNFAIKAGDPLMVVMPFKREKWGHKIMTASEQISLRSYVENWYKNLFHKNKSFD